MYRLMAAVAGGGRVVHPLRDEEDHAVVGKAFPEVVGLAEFYDEFAVEEEAFVCEFVVHPLVGALGERLEVVHAE